MAKDAKGALWTNPKDETDPSGESNVSERIIGQGNAFEYCLCGLFFLLPPPPPACKLRVDQKLRLFEEDDDEAVLPVEAAGAEARPEVGPKTAILIISSAFLMSSKAMSLDETAMIRQKSSGKIQRKSIKHGRRCTTEESSGMTFSPRNCHLCVCSWKYWRVNIYPDHY